MMEKHCKKYLSYLPQLLLFAISLGFFVRQATICYQNYQQDESSVSSIIEKWVKYAFFRISTDQYFEYFLKFLRTAFVEFPALTLCPDYFEIYKLDALAAYNLTAKEVRGEFFKTSSNLTTYQVYEKVTNNLTELLTDFTIRLNTPLTNTNQVKINYSKYPLKEKPSSKVKIVELKEEDWIRQNYNNFGGKVDLYLGCKCT